MTTGMRAADCAQLKTNHARRAQLRCAHSRGFNALSRLSRVTRYHAINASTEYSSRRHSKTVDQCSLFARDANDPDAMVKALAFKSSATKPIHPNKALKETVLIKEEIILNPAKLEKKTKIVRRDVE